MRSRWLFFSLFCSIAVPGRFIPIFYSAHAISPSQIGIILAVPSLISFFSSPFICNLADRTNREKVAILVILLSISFFIVQAIALPEFHILSAQQRFPFLLLCSFFLGFFDIPIYALISAIAISQLRTLYGQKGHERFGQERLWGAVSWALFSMLLGLVLDIPSVHMYVVYIGKLFTSLGLVLVIFRFSKSKPVREHEDEACALVDNKSLEDIESSHISRNNSSMSPFAIIPQLLSTGAVTTIMFFNMYFWIAVGMETVEKLIFIYFTQDMRASYTLCGLSVIVTVIFEIPMLAVAPDLLQYFGAHNLAVLGGISYAFRVIAYTFLPNAWSLLLFEPLHGFTFAAVSTASVAFIADRVSPRLEATGQSLLNMIQAFATACGTAIGGFILERYGSRILYRGAAVCVLVASFCFSVVERFLHV